MMRGFERKALFAVMLFMICQTISGQSLYDRSNMSIGKIGSDESLEYDYWPIQKRWLHCG